MVRSIWRQPRSRKLLLVEDVRERMIRETNSFLTWALAKDRSLPRIPRRRVSEGGFADLLRRPGASAMVEQWWKRTLEIVNLE